MSLAEELKEEEVKEEEEEGEEGEPTYCKRQVSSILTFGRKRIHIAISGVLLYTVAHTTYVYCEQQQNMKTNPPFGRRRDSWEESGF